MGTHVFHEIILERDEKYGTPSYAKKIIAHAHILDTVQCCLAQTESRLLQLLFW